MTTDLGLSFFIEVIMKLTNRLQVIADLVEEGTTLGDIGSDHGYLAASLVEQKKVGKAIATDINQGPVNNCLQTVREKGLSDQIEVRLGGGFEPYQVGEIETAVIAGMGGELIRDIFIQSPEVVASIKHFILQPMTGQEILRAWLCANGFVIEEERIAVEQDRFYEILVVAHGEQQKPISNCLRALNDAVLLLEIGYQMDEDDNYIGFLNKKIQKYQVIQASIQKHGNDKHPRLIEATEKINKLKEVIACIQTQRKS